MNELSNNELLILDILMQFERETGFRNNSVSQIVTRILHDKDNQNIPNMSKAEIDAFVNSAQAAIKKNPEFGKYYVVDSGRAPGQGAPMATFLHPESGDAVVAFWGSTGNDEWYDNVKAAGEHYLSDKENPGSVYQDDALAYVTRMAEKYGLENITVTGHSKGGNKAQYTALFSDKVDRCVSFDGQGFTPAFVNKYAQLIQDRQGVITSVSADRDIVNALLQPIAGTRLYVDTSGVPEGHADAIYHKPSILLAPDGELRPTEGVEPSELSLFVTEYSLYMTQIEDDEQREAVIEFLANAAGRIMPALSKEKELEAAIKEVLSDVGNLENTQNVAVLLAYTIEFAEEKELSYQDLQGLVNGIVGEDALKDNWFLSWLLEAALDATDKISADEFVDLCDQIRRWAQGKDLSTWNEVLNYIGEDPVRVVGLLASLDLNAKTVVKAICAFTSVENLGNLLVQAVVKHPIITTLGVAALSIPIVRETLLTVAGVVAAIAAVYVIVNHIIQYWDEFVSAVGKAVDYIEDKISEFYNTLKEAVERGIQQTVAVALEIAESVITHGSRVVNKVVNVAQNVWDFLKDATVAAVKGAFFVSNPLLYIIASKVYRANKEPLRINVPKIKDCVERMNRLASRVVQIDQRLDTLYWRLAQNNIEQGEGIFTSLANMFNLLRADLNVDEGVAIRRKANALTELYEDYQETETWVNEHVPAKI